ncbi:MAG: response regulator [Proteobacteria bacterium]|nr:response regulator [Pseudomonadota bacterium]
MSPARSGLLAIEDDRRIQEFLAAALAGHGYELLHAETAAQGLRLANANKPDIVLVDLGLPDRSGLEVIAELRRWHRGAIIVLSARSQESDKVVALDAGADDYLTKPFGIGELLARLRVAERHLRARGVDALPKTLEIGDLAINLEAYRVTRAGADVHLTPLEFKLLAVLAQQPGRVVTHRQLLREVWGSAYVESAHYLRIYMRALRRKIEADPARPRVLQTEVGVGYRLVLPADAVAGPD